MTTQAKCKRSVYVKTGIKAALVQIYDQDHLDGSDDEKVLEVVIVGEGRVLQHDLLQQLNQLCLQARLHEALDRDRHLLRVLALWQCRRHYLESHGQLVSAQM
jgi:hypothetical protein